MQFRGLDLNFVCIKYKPRYALRIWVYFWLILILYPYELNLSLTFNHLMPQLFAQRCIAFYANSWLVFAAAYELVLR